MHVEPLLLAIRLMPTMASPQGVNHGIVFIVLPAEEGRNPTDTVKSASNLFIDLKHPRCQPHQSNIRDSDILFSINRNQVSVFEFLEH